MMENAKKQYYDQLFCTQIMDIKKLLPEAKKVSLSLYMLTCAVRGDYKEANRMLIAINPDELDEMDKVAYLESKLWLNSTNLYLNLKKQLGIKDEANQIIEIYPEATYATYVLGHIARFQKQYNLALEYFNKLLKKCPTHNGILLNMTATLIFMKKDKEAIRYLRCVRPSFQRGVYMWAILWRKVSVRAIIIAMWIGLILATGLNCYLYIGLMILTILAFLTWWRKDPLISATIFQFACTFSGSWLIGLLIIMLAQGGG